MSNHIDKLRNPTALEAASLSAESALRGELIDRFLKDCPEKPPTQANLARVNAITKGFHARVVRIDETDSPCGRPHHGYALLLMVDRHTFAHGLNARKHLENLTDELLSTRNKSCYEAAMPMGVLMDATEPLTSHPDLPSAKTLENVHQCTMFAPTASLPTLKPGQEHGRIRNTLFARSIEDLLGGINRCVAGNRQINMKLHEGRAA